MFYRISTLIGIKRLTVSLSDSRLGCPWHRGSIDQNLAPSECRWKHFFSQGSSIALAALPTVHANSLRIDEILWSKAIPLANRVWDEVYYGQELGPIMRVYILCFRRSIPNVQPRTRIWWRKRPPLLMLAARPAIQPESTYFSMRPWIPYTKPKPMFLTKRFRKSGWGSTRSVVE